MSYESARYDYENFMDKMSDFYFEMPRLNNTVKKPFIGFLRLFGTDRMSNEERSRFDSWEKKNVKNSLTLYVSTDCTKLDSVMSGKCYRLTQMFYHIVITWTLTF